MAPYMVADEEYQRKRYGILGQLVNQGRTLARFQVEEIIQTIEQRASFHDLNRGLSLSLPYFNDQTLAMENYSFKVNFSRADHVYTWICGQGSERARSESCSRIPA